VAEARDDHDDQLRSIDSVGHALGHGDGLDPRAVETGHNAHSPLLAHRSQVPSELGEIGKDDLAAGVGQIR
jgi:hypothetical protein